MERGIVATEGSIGLILDDLDHFKRLQGYATGMIAATEAIRPCREP